MEYRTNLKILAAAILLSACFAVAAGTAATAGSQKTANGGRSSVGGRENSLISRLANWWTPRRTTVEVPTTKTWMALLEGATEQIGKVTTYDFWNGWYAGWYPPENTGVCSDVIWRAFKHIGQDLRASVSKDVRRNPKAYPNSGWATIDFRRVRILDTYFKRNAIPLGTALDASTGSLATWQPGDIVTFARNTNGLWHIWFVSDKRNSEGIPYMVDNHGYGVSVRITPLEWPTAIIGHYRIR